MQRMLVTGGCGFIGANLIRQIRNRRWHGEVIVLDNETNGSPRDLPGKGVSFIHGDVREPNAIKRAMAGCDTVIHLAAHTRVIDSIADPRANFEANALGTLNVLLAARDEGTQRVIMASTGGAILGDVPPPIHEEMVAKPIAPYGASKVAAEAYGWAFAGAYGMRVTMLRFSNVYGPLSYRKGSAIAHFFKQILDHQPITVFGDGRQVRDFIFVDDLCMGILQALEAQVDGVYQLGSGTPTSINSLLTEMHAVVGEEWWPSVVYVSERAGEIKQTYCDISKSRKAFDFLPTTTLADGLNRTWQWFRHRIVEPRDPGEFSVR